MSENQASKYGSSGVIRSPSRSTTLVLFTTVFLDFLGFSIVLPYLYFYAQSLGASPFIYGLLVTSFGLMQFVFVPIMGRLSDRFGRRRILLLSLLGSGISFFIFGFASVLWLLFAARIVGGITDSTVSVAQAYIADLVSEEKSRLKYMGMIGAGIGLGFTVGPAIGGVLSSLYGYALPSLIASALAFSNFALAYFRLPESHKVSSKIVRQRETLVDVISPLRKAFANRRLGLLFATNFVGVMAFTFLDVSLAPWLQKDFAFGSLQVGLIFFYSSVVNVVTQGFLVSKLSKRFSTITILLAGIVTLTIAYLGLGLLGSFPLLLVAGGVLTLGFGLITPSISNLISVNSGAEEQGANLGVGQSMGFLAQAIAPVIAASIFSFGLKIDFNGLVFVAAAIINILSLLLVMTFRANTRKQVPPAEILEEKIRIRRKQEG
jgi:multidrug resistance protein